MNTPVQHPQRPGFGFARRNGATLTGWRDNVAEIAYRDGVKPEVLAELRRYFGAPLNLTRHDAAAFERLLRSLYEQGDDARAMVADLDGDFDLKALADDLPEPEDLAESEDDAPIIRLINALLTEAVKEGASDIHIEPFENRLVVRFRIDGVLRGCSPAEGDRDAVVSRIKVMARSTSPRSACRRTAASPCASPAARWTCACRRFRPATASASCCACSTSVPASWTSRNSAWRRWRCRHSPKRSSGRTAYFWPPARPVRARRRRCTPRCCA
jgi:hypothetical protein